MTFPDIQCTNCRGPYPTTGFQHVCPNCGGIYDYASGWRYDPARVDNTQTGIWRYRDSFGLPDGIEPISLGEGNTRMAWVKAFHKKIAFKCEYENPTGSFKDRGSTVIISLLKAMGIKEVVEDSSGNAGVSLAAYSRAAGIKARIYLPESASEAKKRRIEANGAALVPIPGERSQASEAVRLEAERGAIYASHAYLPFNLPGYGTCAYEIFDQLGGKMPGTVIVPMGQGGLLLGVKRGFDSLRIANTQKDGIDSDRAANTPRMIGVQASACAPLWAIQQAGMEGMRFVSEKATIAEGVKIRYPVRSEAVLGAIKNGEKKHGTSTPGICLADEDEIVEGQRKLGRLGFDIEPTSAIVWSALRQVVERAPEPIVVILTGYGRKE